MIILTGLVVVTSMVAAAVVAQQDDHRRASGSPNPSAASTARARGVMEALGGISQVGSILGSSSAKHRLVVYADVGSAQFEAFDRDVLPTLIQRYVKPRRLTVQLRTLPSRTSAEPGATEYAQAAGLQTRLWQFARLLGSGGYAQPLAAAAVIPGLDVKRLRRDATSARVGAAVDRARRLAREAGVVSQPAFRLSGTGTRSVRIPPSKNPKRFTQTLEAALPRVR